MRRPSAEAREKMRFLWTVARFDLGTLDRQQSWLTRHCQPLTPSRPLPPRFPTDRPTEQRRQLRRGPAAPAEVLGHLLGSRMDTDLRSDVGSHRGGVGLRCQAAVGSSPHLATRKSKKVVTRAQKDTPQPTKESVLSSDSSSGPLCRKDRVPGVQSAHRHPDLTGPGSPAPHSNKAPQATALSPVKQGWQ